MRKSITYYLADPKRLTEISEAELQQWLHEEPYSQPLHKLLLLRTEMEGRSDVKILHDNAAHHVIDIDTTTDAAEELEPTPREEVVPVSKVVAHTLASDTLEELVEAEVVEDLSAIEDVVHAATDADAGIATDTEQPTLVDDDYTLVEDESIATAQTDVSTYEVAAAASIDLTDHDVSLPTPPLEIDSEPAPTLAIATEEKTGKDVPLEPQIKGKTTVSYDPEELKIQSAVEPVSDGVDVTTYEVEPDPEVLAAIAKEEEENKPKKKKTKSKKAKTQKVKAKKAKQKKTTGKKEQVSAEPTKSKEQKKGRKANTKRRYVYLEEPAATVSKKKEYDGDSDYIKWLMKTKSINEESKVAVKKKKKSSKKHKGTSEKKSIVLKSAAESVKKKDIIISETLADILAAQGHRKKAKKMYKQLSLIFPKKSPIFAAKIKELKKK